MERLPLLEGENTVGELEVSQEGLYICLSVACGQEEGVRCAWIVGETGQLRIGVLEPLGGKSTIFRKVSAARMKPLGRLLRGEIRPVEEQAAENFRPLTSPEDQFHSPWLCAQLRHLSGVQTRRQGQTLQVAIPWAAGQPFPLPALFCFGRTGTVQEKVCLLFAFDGREQPIFG